MRDQDIPVTDQAFAAACAGIRRMGSPNEYDNVSMNIRVRKIDIVLAAVDCRSRPQRPELRGWGERTRTQKCRFTNAGPNSLVFQNILVPETFREDRFRSRRLKRHLRVRVLSPQPQSWSHGTNSVRVARGRSRSDQD